MNWRIVAILSGAGVAVGAVFLYVELAVWAQWFILLGIAVVYAIVLARLLPEKHFLNGFVIGLISGTASNLLVGVMWDTFLKYHPLAAENLESAIRKMEEAGQSGEWIISLSRYIAILFAPLNGAVNGLIFGVFAWLASRVVRPTHPADVESIEAETIPPADAPPPPS